MTPVQHDELVHILERRLEGPEYQTFCGLVVNLFAPAMLACWPRTMDRPEGEAPWPVRQPLSPAESAGRDGWLNQVAASPLVLF